MASIFCPSCGSKAEYQFSIPNFCSKCGKSYVEKYQNTNSASILKKTRNLNTKIDPPKDADEDFEEEDDFDPEEFSNASRVPRINKIQVEIDSSTDIKVFKFEDLLNSNYNNEFKPSKGRNLNDLT
jgi:DNA-directed RNA polymerase subunit RPC12/RpoP